MSEMSPRSYRQLLIDATEMGPIAAWSDNYAIFERWYRLAPSIRSEPMNTLEKFNLKGKTALVTGCRRGIGMAMAIGLAEAGADIVGVSATLASDGEEVGKKVRETGR